MNPNINLHIDSIVLDGIEVTPGDDRLMQQVVSYELTTLFSRENLATLYRNTSNVSVTSGGTIHLGSTGIALLGQKLARSIHQSFGAASSSPAAQAGEPE